MNNIIESFFIAVLFDDKKTKESANKTQQTISNFAKTALASLTTLLSFDALKSVSLNFEQHANKLGDLADKIGDDVEQIDAYRKAITTVNGDAEEFTGTLTKIGVNLQKLNTIEGRQFKNNLKMFGISVKDSEGYLKSATDVINNYAETYNKLTGQRRQRFIDTMGIDESTIKLLKQGKDGVNKLVKEMYYMGVVSKEQVKIAKEFRSAQRELEFSFQFVTNKIGAFLLPALTKMAQFFKNTIIFLQEHKELTKGFFIAIATAITSYLIPAFLRLSAALLVNPFTYIILGITALVALFAILYEEFQDFKKTGVSDFKPLFDIIISISDAIDDFINNNKELINTLKEIGKVGLSALSFIAKLIFLISKYAISNLIESFKSLISIIKTIGGFIYDYVLTPILKVLEKFNVLGKVKDFFKSGNKLLDNVISNNQLPIAKNNELSSLVNSKRNSPQFMSQMKNGIVNTSKTNTIKDSNNQTNNITINTASSDPKNLAETLKTAIPKQKVLDTLQFDQGVLI